MIPAEILSALVAAVAEMNECKRTLEATNERLHREKQRMLNQMQQVDEAQKKFSDCLDAFMKACN